MVKRDKREVTDQFCGDMQSAQERYGVGYHSVKKIANECDAVIKIGSKVVRYNFKKMDAYLNSISGKENKDE